MAKVEQRAWHGKIDVESLAETLALQFNAGETRAQWLKRRDGSAIVQVRSRRVEADDPSVALTLQISPTPTGIVVTMGEQAWLGVAADLLKTGLLTLLNPIHLLSEIDDVARNLRRLHLRDELWKAIEHYCRLHGGGKGGSPFEHVICPYCGTPNPVGQLICSACRAPLADVQPIACPRCGFLNDPHNDRCVQCGAILDKGVEQR